MFNTHIFLIKNYLVDKNIFKYNVPCLKMQKSFKSKWKHLTQFSDLSLKINHRPILITPNFVNRNLDVYNGIAKKTINVNYKHIGLKLGELFLTKIIAKYRRAK